MSRLRTAPILVRAAKEAVDNAIRPVVAVRAKLQAHVTGTGGSGVIRLPIRVLEKKTPVLPANSEIAIQALGEDYELSGSSDGVALWLPEEATYITVYTLFFQHASTLGLNSSTHIQRNFAKQRAAPDTLLEGSATANTLLPGQLHRTVSATTALIGPDTLELFVSDRSVNLTYTELSWVTFRL